MSAFGGISERDVGAKRKKDGGPRKQSTNGPEDEVRVWFNLVRTISVFLCPLISIRKTEKEQLVHDRINLV
jgi:hypothetical protein